MDIATLSSNTFTALIGRSLTIEGEEGELALEVFRVIELPRAAGPNAKRTPFTLLLRGPDTPALLDGCYHLRADGSEGWRIEGVLLSRILPHADSDGTGAFYEAVFA